MRRSEFWCLKYIACMMRRFNGSNHGLKKIVALNLEGEGVLEIRLLCLEFSEGLSNTYFPKECHLLGPLVNFLRDKLTIHLDDPRLCYSGRVMYQILHILLHCLVSLCCFGRSLLKNMDNRLESAILVLIFEVASTRLVP